MSPPLPPSLLLARKDGVQLEILVVDITSLDVDAIVNAAHTSLLGGGGVDGAIHRAAGDELLAACRKLGGCATGDAKITPGFHLPARYVIHAVGPVWNGGGRGEDELLASCYRRAIDLAAEKRLQSLAFPAISTGVYQFPVARAAGVAVANAAAHAPGRVRRILFCCFSQEAARSYEAAFRDCGLQPGS